eukprot:7011421-Pyramimonas_sp.AAC.1
MVVPWATNNTKFSDVLNAASVHSCFHIADPSCGLEADPVTVHISKLVQTMRRKGVSEDEILKTAA